MVFPCTVTVCGSKPADPSCLVGARVGNPSGTIVQVEKAGKDSYDVTVRDQPGDPLDEKYVLDFVDVARASMKVKPQGGSIQPYELLGFRIKYADSGALVMSFKYPYHYILSYRSGCPVRVELIDTSVVILGRGSSELATAEEDKEDAAAGEEEKVEKPRRHKRRAPEPPKEAAAEAAAGGAAAAASAPAPVPAPSEARPSKVVRLTHEVNKGGAAMIWEFPWREGMRIRDVLATVLQDDTGLSGIVGGAWPSVALNLGISEAPVISGSATCVVLNSSEIRR